MGHDSSGSQPMQSHSLDIHQETDRYRSLAEAFRKRNNQSVFVDDSADNESISMEGIDEYTNNPTTVFTARTDYTSDVGGDDTLYTATIDDTRIKDDNEEDVTRYTLQLDDEDDTLYKQNEEVYLVRQQWPWCSILFSTVQTIILAIMMWQCGVAPFKLNPMIGPFPDALSEWGGKNSVLILQDNQAWRLLTPTFLHAGVIHLVANLTIQLTKGAFFEREWGSYRWLIVYLVSAVGSNVLSVIFLPQAVSVGSSGAVMGLFGGKLAEVIVHKLVENSSDYPVSRRDSVAQTVRRRQYETVTTSVIVILLFSFVPFVDWAAHFGGLIAGFLIGIAVFGLDLKTHRCLQIFVSWCGLFATVYVFFKAMQYMYKHTQTIPDLRDVCGYYKQNFAEYECNCMRSEMNQYGSNSNNNYNGNTGGNQYDKYNNNYDGGGYNNNNYDANNYYNYNGGYDNNNNNYDGNSYYDYAGGYNNNNYYDYAGGYNNDNVVTDDYF